ncbi:FkbM family methyltransferase [Roseicyclus marinus]|uniref:FkbM family methyltransferase n=1 Tax=Roseicyclus marinus TaxID=2161673 RepID=UPI00240F6816|nr:FkbM family methyltransferase [Roseicyclus marinus]MDG3042908.1 FkbM family methyltransferase [Roseicyclus marinus]
MDCDPDIVAELHGVRIPAAPHLAPRTIASIRSGLYERPEIEGILVNLRPGDRVVELGSGAGIVSSIIARNFDEVQVRTFEGNPNLIDHIRKMHAVNGLSDRVEVRNALVMAAPDPDPFTLFSVSSSYLGSRIAEPGTDTHDDDRIFRVENLPYADLRESFPHNVLVMDIEGAELDFLAAADLSGIDFLIVELHPTVYGADKAAECIRHIEAAGLVLDPASSDLQVKAFKTPARMRLGIDRSRVAWRDIPDRLAFDPDSELAGAIEWFDAAVMVKSPGFAPEPVMASVFDADQREIPGAIAWHDATTRATQSRHHPRPKRITDIGGTWLFGGALDPEAPMALQQLLARLWALPHLTGPAPRGIVVFPHGPAAPEVYAAFLDANLSLWAPGLEPLVLGGPSRFETLIVPPQGVASGRLRHGTADFRAFVRARATGTTAPGTGAPILLHDTRLGRLDDTLLQTLTGTGYTLHDLALTPIPEAITRITGASTILVAGSSAEDLVLYTAPDETPVASLIAAKPDGQKDFETLARLYGLAAAHAIPLPELAGPRSAAALDSFTLHLAVQGLL